MTLPGRLAPLALAAAAALLAAGCAPAVPEPEPTTPPSAAPTASPSASPTAAPTPTPEPSPTPLAGRPIEFSCEQLITLQQMYDINPNLALLGPFEPAAGSLAVIALAENGLACRWLHTSSGETIDVAIADLPGPLLDQRRAEAGTPTGAYGIEGWFDDGRAQAISGSYWISVDSALLFDAAEAAAFVEAARP